MVMTAHSSNSENLARIAITVVVGMLAACSPRHPERPNHLPASAVWAGGSDGGAWIACNRLTPTLYDCAVYDARGKLWSKDTYTIQKSVSAGNYEGYDGVRILLQDGGYLEPASSQTRNNPH